MAKERSSLTGRGDAAFFGGVEYQISPTLGVKAEYSSIGYPVETFTPAVDYQSPWNVGITWRPSPGTELSLAYLYGSEISASATFLINPEKRPQPAGWTPRRHLCGCAALISGPRRPGIRPNNPNRPCARG